MLCGALVAAGCSSDTGASRATTAPPVTATTAATSAAPTTITTVAPTTPPTTVAPTSTSTTIAPTTTVAATTTVPAADVHHVFPVQDAAHTSFGETHSGYPATDIFHTAGCGTQLVSPVDGVVLEVRRDNVWDPAVDDPDTRGGRTLAIVGDDGVRYYMAHFQAIDGTIQVGVRLAAGDPVGQLGDSGRTSACHLHFGLSPVCTTPEWWVRRGVIWPARYLRDWRDGVNTSPVPEIDAWSADHPDACTQAPGGGDDSG